MAYTLVPTELIVDGAVTSAKLDTNISISGTLGVTGELTLATHMIMGDNDKIKIGTGGDLEIYHDGSNSYISNSTGNIYLADTNGSVHIQAKLNEESIVCTADGAVSLYYDNAVKLATTSTGIDVTSNDSTNNSVSTLLKLSHTTTGTAADGIGTRINFESEDDGGTVSTMGYIDTLFTDVSDGAEKSAIQFYTRSGGSIARQMHIDSTGVGIGTDSPDEPLHIFSSTDADLLLEGTEAGTSTRFAKVAFANNISGTTTDLGAITANTDGATNSSSFKFFTANAGSVTNKMTITSGDAVLVGKDSDAFATAGVVLATSQNSSFTRNSGNVLALRRNTNDGDLVTLYKDTAKIGSIASRGGTTASFITNTASGSGAGISGSTNMVIACDETGAANGSTVSLGSTSTKWKDLYLSGSITSGGSNDIDGTDDLRLRFLNGGSFKAGIQVPTTSGDMISGSAVDDLAIRSQANILFSTGGNVEKVRIDSLGKLLIGDSASHTDDLLQIETPASGGGHGIQIRRNDSNGDQGIGRIMFGNNNDTDLATISSVTDGQADCARLVFSTQPTSGNSTERMRITSDGEVRVNAVPRQTMAEFNNRQNGACIEFGHENNSNGFYGTLGVMGSNGSPYIGFSTDCESSANTFTTRGYKGNIIRGDSSGNLNFQQVTNASATGQNPADRMKLDSNGTFMVGKTSSSSNNVGFETSSTGNTAITRDGGQPLILNRKTDHGDILIFRKDGSEIGKVVTTTTGNGSIVIGNDNSGIMFRGDLTGSAFIPADPATGNQVDNSLDIGHSVIRFDDVYATNGTIQTSDRNEKQDIEALTDAETRVAVAAKGLLRKFRWQSAVSLKGDEARIHFGIIAQDLQDAFTAEGLDAGDYAMFISSTWTDDDGAEQTRLGVRYSELLAFIIAAI